MTTDTHSPDVLHVRDAIELPDPDVTIHGRAERDDSYPIHVVASLDETVERLLALIGDRRVAVITDRTVAALHGDLLKRLTGAGVELEVATIAAGEAHKTLGQACDLLDWLTGTDLARRDLVLAFGGGVVIDMGGWVASAYMRGIPYVNVPTTLVAQVDAGIGGKLGVNHPVAKNLIGGFFQPSGVVSNVGFLATLGRRQLQAGLAESIKKAIISSPAYWELIERRADSMTTGDPGALRQLVHGASAIKAELIARDPYEADSRRTLGFGHALAHPLETVSAYRGVLHGEAVAFGMVVEAHLSAARGLMSPTTFDAILALLRRVGLPTAMADLPDRVEPGRLLTALERIRLIRGGGFRFVLPIEIGECVIADDVTPDELNAALRRTGLAV